MLKLIYIQKESVKLFILSVCIITVWSYMTLQVHVFLCSIDYNNSTQAFRATKAMFSACYELVALGLHGQQKVFILMETVFF